MSTIICDICLEEYGDNDKSEKAPKMLSCGHTFCCKCIKNKMNRDKNQIICSICREVEERIYDKIPFNRIIYDLILKEKEQNNNYKFNSINSKDYDVCFNIGMIGFQFTGKTSLSSCIQNNKPIIKNSYKSTINLDFFFKFCHIEGKTIMAKIWDTAGTERFNSVSTGYLRGLHGCFIVYDITDEESFYKLNTWIEYYNDFNQYKEKIMIILGNKVDKEEKRKISFKEAKNYCDSKNLLYFETSAINMKNVNEAFKAMMTKVLKSKIEGQKPKYIKKIKKQNTKEIKKRKSSSGCC